MALLDRSRRAPRVSRRVTLAGSPSFPQATTPEPAAESDEKPKKRATRKRAAKKAETDE
jgi:hypothetical protein